MVHDYYKVTQSGVMGLNHRAGQISGMYEYCRCGYKASNRMDKHGLMFMMAQQTIEKIVQNNSIADFTVIIS